MEGARISDFLLMEKNRLGMVTIPSTGLAIQLTNMHPPLIDLRLTNATDLELPVEATADRGLFFVVMNNSTAAAAATLKTSTGGALTPAAAVPQNYIALAVTNGARWSAMVANIAST
jgi:hypothetical protein